VYFLRRYRRLRKAGGAMSPQKRLQAAREATQQGRYDEALQEFIWFHEHALEHQPWLYGLRLSFALGYWIELANLYPPAREALEAMRDRKTTALLRGEGKRPLFHDVVAINRVLARPDLTHALIVRLEADYPDLAHECVALALPAIVATGDYALAYRHIPDPTAALKKEGAQLNESIAALEAEAPTLAPRFAAYVQIYCENVRMLSAVLHGVGQAEAARVLGESAIELVDSPSAREAVRSLLHRASKDNAE
ncbi:MAG TPA: hypothetical protein VJU83_08705, partial [Burkholderiales bacterium]|nr:hypothetical protein [Burkholderiales bacterium]